MSSSRGSLVRRRRAFLGGSLSALLVILVTATAAWAAPGEIQGRPDAGGDPLGMKSLHANSVQKEVEDNRIPGHYIVVLKSSVEHPGTVAEAQTESRDGDLGLVYRSALKGYSASDLSKSDVESLREDPRVKYVEPDRRVEATAQTTPNGVKRIGAATNPALDIDETDDVRVNADVAVIDTGIDYTHPDLSVFSRTNCVPANEDPEGAEWNVKACVDNAGTDGDGHGTHVAGTIGALDNGIGVVGVAPGARLWAVRVLNNQGGGSNSWVIAGIDWVTAHAAQIEVANMSIGAWGRSPAQETAIKASVEAGVVYVVAAGNSAVNAASQAPANGPDVITVSALADSDGKAGGKGGGCAGADDTLALFSNWGADVEIAAPGTCVYSTLPGNSYGSMNGTSMASPHVAGAAAVLAAKSNPNSKKDVEAIRQTLIDEASLEWEDNSEDARFEPLLYLGAEPLKAAEVATGGWSSDATKGTTVTGAINPRGQKAEYRFEYGPTTSYGSSTSVEVKEGKYAAVSRKLEGLELGKTYHYRLSATTASGTVYGKDRTLRPALWSRQTLNGQPSSEIETLWGVSCPTDAMCMAVGRRQAEGSLSMVSYKLSEGKWSYVAMPIPNGGSYPIMANVSCKSATSCMAVGSYKIGNGGPGTEVLPLVESWNGSAWSVQSVPVPPSEATTPFAELEDVSCVSVTECTAVGFYMVADEDPEHPGYPILKSYVSQLKSGKWTNSYPLAPNIYMQDISCTSATFCAAATAKTLMTWNGSSWSSQSLESASSVMDVSCTSQSFCLAIGNELNEVWDGSKWSAVPAAEESLEESGEAIRWDVSCSSPTDCLVAGYHYYWWKPTIETWNGSEMKSQAAAHSPDETGMFLASGCSPSHTCVSVGMTMLEHEQALITSTPDRRPSATTEAATVEGSSKATLKGTVNPNGVTTSYRFEYGPTTAYGTSIPVPAKEIGAGKGAVEVKEALTGLTPEGTYHYRVVAESEGGTAKGEDKTFTLPYIITEPATGLFSTGATLKGKVDPAGLATSYQFEYGTTTAYGSKAPAAPKAIGSGTGYVSVSEALEGLKVGTTYHYRVVGTNSKGTLLGKDATFTTPPTSLYWYRCGAWGGAGVYEDASCSKKGASNSYSWLRPASSVPFTTSNTLKGVAQAYIIKYNWSGSLFEIVCKTSQGEGTLSNAEARAEITGYKLTLSNCTEPLYECKIPNGKIVFNTMKATSPQSPETLNQEMKFVPSEGTIFTTYEFKECGFSGTFKLVGSFKEKLHNEASWLGSTISEMWAAGTLRLQNPITGAKVGIEGVSVISSEGKPAKLDAGP